MHIAIAGLGYVGLSLACLLSQHNEVSAVDIDASRIERINAGISPIADPLIERYLASHPQSLHATGEAQTAYARADLVIIATPTNYDDETHSFDTSSIESVLDLVASSDGKPTVVIKSTVPVGYTDRIAQGYPMLRILFSPEFLREGHALEDNLHPSRIVVGVTRPGDKDIAWSFAKLLSAGAKDDHVPALVMGSTEAEAIKLFANTYLALRVSFFNELDTYAESKGLDTQAIIEGVSLDPRIGNQYNNPSFGYGGYCLPKDSKQLLSNYADVPQNLIRAIVESNATRKRFVAERVLALKPRMVGIYRLVMKSGSDNFRQSAMLDVVRLISDSNVPVIIYEPTLTGDEALDHPLVSLDELKSQSDVILANRWNDDLADVRGKVYTRDLWQRD
ncbi:nucleotide sugar dehydrogenase [Olsenella profusa]|uniref:UDP-glucose 6-dehydrogenase n=1 Tax=Olsenella profusa TaxID=138595 RepID=A0ABS2F1V4_9ACTN|nr:nucleotide sugar dehydrogenase [Olsenella profusa]MBM6774808.1 nucleotide sugar dehydrogenase [Olsenella profusa]